MKWEKALRTHNLGVFSPSGGSLRSIFSRLGRDPEALKVLGGPKWMRFRLGDAANFYFLIFIFDFIREIGVDCQGKIK